MSDTEAMVTAELAAREESGKGGDQASQRSKVGTITFHLSCFSVLYFALSTIALLEQLF